MRHVSKHQQISNNTYLFTLEPSTFALSVCSMLLHFSIGDIFGLAIIVVNLRLQQRYDEKKVSLSKI